MENTADVKTALKRLTANAEKYEKTERYYAGDHDLAFATKKFRNAFGELFREFSLNLCPAVCDALRDKLKIKNYYVEAGDADIPKKAWEIWQNNRMGVRSGEVHKEAVKNGDAYAIVWVNPNGQTTIYPQKAQNCAVVYDEETPGKILWAAKIWKTPERRARLNLYYPNRIERYIHPQKIEGGVSAESIFFLIDDDVPIIPNPYGIVPVFHFANNSDIGMPGMSELQSAMPIQDALNKSVLDMLVAMEFASYRQRWASGIEIEYDEAGNPIPPFAAGIERLWVTENPETRFGDFEAANLEQFLKVKSDFRVDMACVTGTPLYYFMLTNGEVPSGESLKKSETRFINKVTDRQESFGQVWADALSFALLLEGNKNVRLFTDWTDPAPLSEKEHLENVVVKKEIGISDEQALIEAGYGEADIQKMLSEKQAKAERTINQFNAGNLDGL